MGDFVPCTPGNPCRVLAERLEEPNARKKGLVPLWLYNIKTREERFLGIAYKLRANDPGLILNTCPWCGGKTYEQREAGAS